MLRNIFIGVLVGLLGVPLITVVCCGVGWLLVAMAQAIGIDPQTYPVVYIPIAVFSVTLTVSAALAYKHIGTFRAYWRHTVANVGIGLYVIAAGGALLFIGGYILFALAMLVAGFFGIESENGKYWCLILTFVVCSSVAKRAWNMLIEPPVDRMTDWADR